MNVSVFEKSIYIEDAKYSDMLHHIFFFIKKSKTQREIGFQIYLLNRKKNKNLESRIHKQQQTTKTPPK